MDDQISPKDHQIEELLLNAHFECESGVDLIEEYFSSQSSLDQVTEYAYILLQKHTDPQVQNAIIKNLSECIVVKNQNDKKTFWGLMKRVFSKLGFDIGKNKEITRAEKLIEKKNIKP